MDKIKTGRFLKELRNANNLTMKGLIAKLEEENLGVTVKTISDWEAGKTVPELEKLAFLSKLYGVSIEEILGGEKKLTEDYYLAKYKPLAKGFDDLLDTDSDKWQEGKTKCAIDMKKNFKSLLFKAFSSELSLNEDGELAFIFKHGCKLSDYCTEVLGDGSADVVKCLFKAIYWLKNNPDVKTKEEFYWEFSKFYVTVSGGGLGRLSFAAVSDESIFYNKRLRKMIDIAEPWEKDELVAGFQNCYPRFYKPDQNAHLLEDYEKKTGKEYDPERIYKDSLKYLLEHGCMLNSYFFNFHEVHKIECTIIDRLEYLHNLCVRPLEVYYSDEERTGFYKRFFVENTPYNRFLECYYSFLYTLPSICCGREAMDLLTPQICFSLIQDDPDNEKFFNWICENVTPTDKREEKYKKADLHFVLMQWGEEKKKYFAKEKEIAEGIMEIKKLEHILKEGKTTYIKEKMVEVGPKTIHDVAEWVRFWRTNLSLEDFYMYRDEERSKQLLSEIDSLTVREIQAKYFPMETIEKEGIEHE